MHSSVSTCQFRDFEGHRVFQHTPPRRFRDFRRGGPFQHTPARPFWDFRRGRLFQCTPAHISGFSTWSALQHTPGSSTSISPFSTRRPVQHMSISWVSTQWGFNTPQHVHFGGFDVGGCSSTSICDFWCGRVVQHTLPHRFRNFSMSSGVLKHYHIYFLFWCIIYTSILWFLADNSQPVPTENLHPWRG